MQREVGENVYLLLIQTSALDGVRGERHTPAGFTAGKRPRYPLDRSLSEPQSRSGHRG
jgi:hypothetical protein